MPPLALERCPHHHEGVRAVPAELHYRPDRLLQQGVIKVWAGSGRAEQRGVEAGQGSVGVAQGSVA